MVHTQATICIHAEVCRYVTLFLYSIAPCRRLKLWSLVVHLENISTFVSICMGNRPIVVEAELLAYRVTQWPFFLKDIIVCNFNLNVSLWELV